MILPQKSEKKVLGIPVKSIEKQSFVLLNFGAGHARVSGNSEISTLVTKALYEEWNNPLSFKTIIEFLGAEIVEQREASTDDFSLELLEKDSFIKILNKNEKQ